jgi:hypothetical protein
MDAEFAGDDFDNDEGDPEPEWWYGGSMFFTKML